ncbi:MAG: inositol monophosphatase family protein [Actinomycetota bacterium]
MTDERRAGGDAQAYRSEWSFAVSLASRAGAFARSFFGTRLDVRHKPDGSPVTDADVAVESMLRAEIAAAYPDDAILGEEGGPAGSSSRTWVLDPIDGTKNFVDGIQLWATIVGLVVDDEPVVGVVDAPALGERYDAIRDGGARLNGTPIHVSSVDRVSDALVLHSGVQGWLGGPYWSGFERLAREAERTRDYCDFWGPMLVARGSAEAILEAELSWPWDWAAPSLIVREAGGSVTTFDGAGPAGACSVLSTNGRVHDEILERLRRDPTASDASASDAAGS